MPLAVDWYAASLVKIRAVERLIFLIVLIARLIILINVSIRQV